MWLVMNCCSKDKHAKTVEEGVKFSWWWCLALVPIALVAIVVFKIPLIWGVFLLCPLMHIFMMKDHGEHGDNKEEKK